MRNYTLEDFWINADKLTSTPEIFRKNFNKLQDVLYEIGIEYYKSFEDFMGEHRDSYTLDILLDSLKEFPNYNKPLAKGDTVCYCYTYNELLHSFEKEEDAIESIRELIIKINLLLRKGYEEDSVRTIINDVLKESANPSESDLRLKYYVQNITNYGMNCYTRYEEDIIRIFAEHGIKFNNHRYGYTSEYTCPGCLMQFDSVTWFFRTRRAEFDEKAKDIMNDICKILPKNNEFEWQGKTVDGCIRNGTVRFAK